MKLGQTDNVVRSRGTEEEIEFSVASSRKAFEVLSNGYQDAIKAIIRELSTNALDAHVDAGNLDQPFIVTLPTMQNPNFKIRDFGTGMSHEKIKTLYSVYFGSDKDESNDFIGCLGIGSKSPFAYKDDDDKCQPFTVISYYGEGALRTKSVYICFITESGTPHIDLMHSEPTTEPIGLEVSMLVRPADIGAFYEKAREVYTHFKNRPIIQGAEMVFSEVEYILEGDGWGVAKGYTQSHASMGSIAYPIVAKHFNETVTTVGNVHPRAPQRYQQGGQGAANNNYVRLLNLGLHIRFDIGELEMTPYREDLKYTRATVAAIKARLDVVMGEIGALINKKFEDCENMWAARLLYKELMASSLSNFRDLVDVVGITYKGEEITTTVVLRKNEHNYTTGITDKTDYIPGTDTLIHFHRGWSNRISRVESVLSIPVDKNTVFIENDIPRGAYAAIRRLMVPSGGNVDGLHNVYLVGFEDDKARQTFCSVMGFHESYMTKASSLPKPPRQKGGKVEKIFEWNGSGWEPTTVDLEDGGVYIELNRGNGVHKDYPRGFGPGAMYHLMTDLKDIGIKMPDVIGVKTAAVEKFRKCDDADWVDLFTYITAKVKEYVNDNNMAQVISDIQAIDKFDNWGQYVEFMKANKGGLKHPNKQFGQFVSKIEALLDNKKKNEAKTKKVVDIASRIGYNVGTGKHQTDLKAEEKKVMAHYEVLQLVGAYEMRYSPKSQLVMKFINKVDE